MPPIPSIPPEDPSLLLAGVSRRLNDIREFQIPRLRDCRGPLDLHRELADELRNDLEGAWGNIQICRELAESQRPQIRATTLGHCETLELDYRDLKSAYREALLSSKRALSASSSRRHELLAPGGAGADSSNSNGNGNGESSKGTGTRLKAPAQVGLKDEDALQTKTNEVTDALRRTTQLMQTELERSVLSVQMLEESTRTLRSTTTLYDRYTGLLETSGKLLKALEKADFYDRLMIGAAFAFFLLCVFWIIKRRVLDKVVGGVGWWVLGSGKLIGMGLGLGNRASKAPQGHLHEHGRLGPANVGRLGKPAADLKTHRRSGGGNQADHAAHSREEKPLLADVIPPEGSPSGSEIKSHSPPASEEQLRGVKDEL